MSISIRARLLAAAAAAALFSGATGRTRSAQAQLVGGKMDVRAYLGTPLVGQTMVVRRVN